MSRRAAARNAGSSSSSPLYGRSRPRHTYTNAAPGKPQPRAGRLRRSLRWGRPRGSGRGGSRPRPRVRPKRARNLGGRRAVVDVEHVGRPIDPGQRPPLGTASRPRAGRGCAPCRLPARRSAGTRASMLEKPRPAAAAGGPVVGRPRIDADAARPARSPAAGRRSSGGCSGAGRSYCSTQWRWHDVGPRGREVGRLQLPGLISTGRPGARPTRRVTGQCRG